MTTRETSRKAYQQLVESGALRGHQATILSAVIDHPDKTSGEICKALAFTNVNGWRARFTELQERGLIAESGRRVCKVSGREGVTWVYTGRTKPLEEHRNRTPARELRALLKRALPFIENAPGAEDIRDDMRKVCS